MNKNTLLVIVAAMLMVLSAGAQSRRSDAPRPTQQLSLSRMDPKVDVQAMQRRTPGTRVATPARSTAPLVPFYRRPAGAFYCSSLAVYGGGWYSYGHEFALLKPFSDYTFYGSAEGADEQTYYAWDVYYALDANQGNMCHPVDSVKDVTVSYEMSVQDMPIFYAVDGDPDDPDSKWYSYQMPHPIPEYDAGSVDLNENAMAYAVPSPDVFGVDGVEYLLSSKTTCKKGRYGNLEQDWIYFATGYTVPENPSWWFGKNSRHIDGMAQAFEKPEHPYLLKKVYMYATRLECNAPVSLNCRIYRLDEIPSYLETESVILPEEPGTLVAFGEALITPSTYEDKYGLVEFTLFEHDEDDPELTYEINPTIDYPILVVIDGYNDPEAADLVDFSAMVSADYLVDEGYGELAYLKCPINDSDGNFTGNYEWTGLNNFFTAGTMKTAFTIFIVAEHPFITFNYDWEDGEFLFPDEGGILVKNPIHAEDFYEPIEGIEFYSWLPSEDWEILWNGSDDLPDWLNIELTDNFIDGEFTGLVTAHVTADPLPEGVQYREAKVRLWIPGDYIDYKFMQGEKVGPPDPFDPENPIVTINKIIDLILTGNYEERYDINGDGEITIADVNEVVYYIYCEID